MSSFNRGGFGGGGGPFGGGGNVGGGYGGGDNTTTTTYNDSASQFAGQGFLSSQMDGGATSPSSPASPSKSQQGIIQTLTPVTVRQLHNAQQAHPEDVFKVDNRELSQVTIVGQIMSVQVQSTNVELVVDDSTATIEVRMWLEADDTNSNSFLAQKRAQWTEGKYVRIIGHLRAFMNKRNLIAFRIQPIEDFNEVTYHMLESLHAHLYFSKGPLGDDSNASMQSRIPQGSFSNSSYGQRVGGNLNTIQQDVIEIIKTAPDSVKGCYKPEIVRTLPQYSENEINQTLEYLCNEGRLYYTIDEEHFKCA